VFRAAAHRDSGLPAGQSNSLFLAIRTSAFDTLRDLASVADVDYIAALDDRTALAELLMRRLRHCVATMDSTQAGRRAAFAVAARVFRYAAESWNPSRPRGPVDRGACKADVAGLPLWSRQAVGAYYTARVKSESTRQRVRDAYAEVKQSGKPPAPTAVATLLGRTEHPVSERTVRRHWAATTGPDIRC
jgi:hypothetical protein